MGVVWVAAAKPFKIRTKNSIYEFDLSLNRYRKVGNGWAEGWKPCLGGEMKAPIMGNRYTIVRYSETLSTSCIREIDQ